MKIEVNYKEYDLGNDDRIIKFDVFGFKVEFENKKDFTALFTVSHKNFITYIFRNDLNSDGVGYLINTEDQGVFADEFISELKKQLEIYI